MNKEDKEWLDQASGCKDKIENSDLYAGVVTNSFMKDPACVLQLGYALLMGKPILLIVDKSVTIPPNLVRVAALIHRIDINDANAMKEAGTVVANFAASMK